MAGQVLKRPSGSYAIRWHDPAGRRHYETAGRSRREAEQLLAKRLHDQHQPGWQPASSETLAAYAGRWLERRDPNRTLTAGDRRRSNTRLSPSTHREYRRSLELHVLPRLGQRRLTDLTPSQIDWLIGELEDDGLAPGTIRNTISPLRKLLADAHRQRLIPSNPAVGADLPPIQEFIGQELPPEHTQAIRDALLELAPPHPLHPDRRDLLWVHHFDLALGTGIRQGELRALQWRHIHADKRLIRIEQAYSRSEIKRPKTPAGIRSIPIFPSVLTALQHLHERAAELRIDGDDELLFQTAAGKPIHPSNHNRRIWQPALRQAHLTHNNGKTIYRPYDLRHTCISRLVASGADIKLIQQIAGHANPLITLNRYSHLLDQRLTSAADQHDPAA